MSVCEEHRGLIEKIDHVVKVVNKIDHGLNGVSGSIGLIKRVERIEKVINKNKVLWSNWRGLASHTAILVRMGVWAILMLLGSALLGLVMGGG